MACSASGAAATASWQASQPAITHDKWRRTKTLDFGYGITTGPPLGSRFFSPLPARPGSIRLTVLTALLVLAASPTLGQTEPAAPEHHHAAAPAAAVWTWTSDANGFFGYNYQQRKYADFSAW